MAGLQYHTTDVHLILYIESPSMCVLWGFNLDHLMQAHELSFERSHTH